MASLTSPGPSLNAEPTYISDVFYSAYVGVALNMPADLDDSENEMLLLSEMYRLDEGVEVAEYLQPQLNVLRQRA